MADVLYYNGDVVPNLVAQKHTDPLLGRGYDYDVCNEEVLLTRLSVKNGKLTLPDGMSYRILVLPDSTRMPLEVMRKISSLVKAGATIIGPKPLSDSGLKNYPLCDHELAALANQLWGKTSEKLRLNTYGNGRVFFKESIRNVLLNDGIKPDFECSRNADDLDFIHRSTPEAEIYFVANKRGKTILSDCTFRIKSRSPEIWDPVKGTIRRQVNFTIADGRVQVPLKFEAFQSWFIVFPKSSSAAVKKTASNYPDLKPVQELSGPWQVKFDARWGGPESVKFDSLQDWSLHSDQRIRYFSGTAIYTKQFESALSPDKNTAVYLDLGTVKNIAEVTLNGKKLGIIWTAPWQVNIAPALKQGSNELKIEVVNLWPNRLIGDAALPKEQRLTNTNISFKKEDKLLASGLLGPVVIKK
ncbi:Glycosyl hydrolases family 2, sugar binding domain [compost metagenome]